MSGRHHAARRRPAKGSPFTLAEHFMVTLLVAGFLMLGIVTLAYLAQDNDPVPTVCNNPTWGCAGPHHAGDHPHDTSTPQGATP